MSYAPSTTIRSQQSDTTSATTAMTPVPFSPFSSTFSIGSEETSTSEGVYYRPELSPNAGR